jgi:hypothetical protein
MTVPSETLGAETPVFRILGNPITSYSNAFFGAGLTNARPIRIRSHQPDSYGRYTLCAAADARFSHAGKR